MAAKVIITPTTCDSLDRFQGFAAIAQQYAVGAAGIAFNGKPLRLQLVRIEEGGQTRYEIQVV